MQETYPSLEVKLDNVLVATDFSTASKEAVLYATAIARRHNSKLFIVHVVTSRSESALMDGWRAGQAEIIEQLLANRLDGIEHELVVKTGQVAEVLSRFIVEQRIDLVVVGTRGRTGVLKLLLGSVAENIFRRALCPVLTVGPNISSQNPEMAPERILASTGFAAHSVFGVRYAISLAQNLHASIALLHVVTEAAELSGDAKSHTVTDRVGKLRTLIPANVNLASEPLLLVEFGPAPEKILQTAAAWNANLIVLGLHNVQEASTGKETWARAYEIVSRANCPVLTVRSPEPG
jgi:nucleotide-binding universal stress UspA family protein